jgi:hypothetical protein
MTNIDADAFNRQIEEQQNYEQLFYQWCDQHNLIPLSRWMKSNRVLSQDLFAAGLIEYDDPKLLPVSMSIFSEPKLTEQALSLLGQHEPTGSGYVNRFWFSYLLDETQFHQILKPHLLKTSAQRRKDFIAEYKAKHGDTPSKTDLERYNKFWGRYR